MAARRIDSAIRFPRTLADRYSASDVERSIRYMANCIRRRHFMR
jgi:hypothetical protein